MIVKVNDVDISTQDLNGFTPQMEKDSFNRSKGTQYQRSCSLNIFTKSTFIPKSGQNLEVYDDDGTTLLFGGDIQLVSGEEEEKKQTADAIIKLALTSDGYNVIAKRRTIAIDMADTTAGAVVTFCGNVLATDGVTLGTIVTGATVSIYQETVIKVYDVLDAMAEASGCVWYIDDSKQLHFVETDVLNYASVTLDPVDGFGDFFDFDWDESLEDYRNKQWVLGDGVSVVVENTAEIVARKIVEGGDSSGVYGETHEDNEIVTEADAIKVANELLNRYGIPGSISFVTTQDVFTPEEMLEVNHAKHGIYSTFYMIETVNTSCSDNILYYEISAVARSVDSFTNKSVDSDIEFFKKLANSNSNNSSGTTTGTLTQLDFRTDGFDATYDNVMASYDWTKDTSGRITKLTDNDSGEEIIVNWA